MYPPPQSTQNSRASHLLNVDSNTVTGLTVEELERREHKVLDDSRVRLCSSVVVSEVQSLKAEVEILKRSLSEEKEARQTGDALGGEAALQLQAVVEREKKERAGTMRKLEEHFEAVLSRLYTEISEIRQMAEGKPPRNASRDIDSGDVQSLRMEHTETKFEINQRFDDVNQRIEEITKSFIDGGTQNFGSPTLLQRIEDERIERQMEDESMHKLLNQLAEQTSVALKGEAARLWEALQTHNHDLMIEGTAENMPGKISVQTMGGMAPTQTLPKNGGGLGPSLGPNPRTITLNHNQQQSLLTPTMSTSQMPPVTTNRDMVPFSNEKSGSRTPPIATNRDVIPFNTEMSRGPPPPLTTTQDLMHFSNEVSSRYQTDTLFASTHKEGEQLFSNEFSQRRPSQGFEMGSMTGSFQPRIRVPGLYP